MEIDGKFAFHFVKLYKMRGKFILILKKLVICQILCENFAYSKIIF